MEPTTAALLAAIAPVTAAVFKAFELWLTRAKQKHEIAQATAAQNHKITTEYLDRALNPETPLATRHALLRFLATKASENERLQRWAEAELVEVDRRVAPFNHKVDEALATLNSAKDVASYRKAQVELQLAREKRDALLAPPQQVVLTPSAVRAGFFAGRKDLGKIEMVDANLVGADLNYADLPYSNFAGSDLKRCSFQGADVRATNFSRTNLTHGMFFSADCRGADFTEACLQRANLRKARLEGADLRGADLSDARVECIYDDTTIWPEGFDPEAAGAVKVSVLADVEPTPSVETPPRS